MGFLGPEFLDLLLHQGDPALPIGFGHALAEPADGRLEPVSLVNFRDDLACTFDQFAKDVTH
jgi:hypothetical protein